MERPGPATSHIVLQIPSNVGKLSAAITVLEPQSAGWAGRTAAQGGYEQFGKDTTLEPELRVPHIYEIPMGTRYAAAPRGILCR